MSDRPVQILIEDICEAADKIAHYIDGRSFDTFVKDEMCADAVVRNLQIIGEAANRLPDEFKEEHSTIEWYKIVGLRHRVVHEYFGVDWEIIWRIITQDLPAFRSTLERIRGQLAS